MSSIQVSECQEIKQNFDLLGCSNSFFQGRNIHQPYGNKNIENYGSV